MNNIKSQKVKTIMQLYRHTTFNDLRIFVWLLQFSNSELYKHESVKLERTREMKYGWIMQINVTLEYKCAGELAFVLIIQHLKNHSVLPPPNYQHIIWKLCSIYFIIAYGSNNFFIIAYVSNNQIVIFFLRLEKMLLFDQ